MVYLWSSWGSTSVMTSSGVPTVLLRTGGVFGGRSNIPSKKGPQHHLFSFLRSGRCHGAPTDCRTVSTSRPPGCWIDVVLLSFLVIVCTFSLATKNSNVFYTSTHDNTSKSKNFSTIHTNTRLYWSPKGLGTQPGLMEYDLIGLTVWLQFHWTAQCFFAQELCFFAPNSVSV